jgi:hypothetical protein
MRNWLLLLCVVGGLQGPASLAAEVPGGTLGLTVTTLFDPDEPSHRGDLVVLEVWDGTPAVAAGVQRGDIVVAVDGIDVTGKDANLAFKSQLHGAIGGTVHLTLVRPAEGMRQLHVDLARVALPPMKNPAFETFGYSVPRSWRLESYSFPLPWSPGLPYSGIEDVLFVPDFADRAAPGYHALVWVWWLAGHPPVDAGTLRSTLLQYFRGLSQERGASHHFTPQLEKVTATLRPVSTGAAPAPAAPAASAFRGEVITYNPQGELIALQVDIEAPPCPGENHTALLFRLATQPREAAIWKDLHEVTDSFRCQRAPGDGAGPRHLK